LDHEHLEIDGIQVSRDISTLVEKAKNANLSNSEQIEIGYALEIWHSMAVRCERAIHRMAKGESL